MPRTSSHSDRSSGRHPRVAVVGAGPGGLATAMLLAAKGVDVEIFERQEVVGGRTRRLEDGPYRFDCGPTFFMMPYVLEEIFAATGASLADRVELERLDPMYRLVLGRPDGGDHVLDATADIPEMARRISAISPSDGPAFERFVVDNRRKLELMTPILRRAIRSPLDLISLDAVKAAPVIRPGESLWKHLGRYFEHPQIRLAMSFQSKYLGMSPFECPSLFSILPFIEYEYGIWHPVGGCNALVRAMAARVEELGGVVRCGTPVERILFEGSRTTGLVAGGETHHFDHVVMNADAAWALKNLVPEERRRGWSDEKLDSRRYSCSTFMLYLGIEGEIDLPHHTIRTSPDYERNLQDIAVDGRLSETPSFYVCNPSRLDPTLAPAGHSSLYVLVPTPNTTAEIDWNVERDRLREQTLDLVSELAGAPNLRERIRSVRTVTPETWQSEGIHVGATFNMAHSLPQMLHKRPPHRLPGTDGLWLVGGGTHPGSGLPVIFLSSQITAKLLCEEEGLGDPTTPRPVESPRLAAPEMASVGV
ncbi:MAG: phytoene desaturase family protein [Planctomycetota bacterium]